MIDKIKQDILQSMKNGNIVKKNILRLIVSECDLLEARGQKVDVEKVIRSLLKGVNESLAYEQTQTLTLEKEILESYLPKSLSKNEIFVELSSYEEELISCKSDGQAIGLAMKSLKGKNLNVEPSDVKYCVEQIRK